MSKLFASISLLLLIFNNSISAQKLIDTTSVRKIDEVIVTGQFSPQAEKNIIYKVKSISNNTINDKAATNLRELLLQELNIELHQNSVFGSNIEMQGISKENIKILVDGVPVIGRLNGIIDLNQINLANIARVEVIEGPVSVFYGTDAMGGVINLITKKTQKKQFEGSVSSSYESINAWDVNGTLGYKFTNNTIRLNVGNYHLKGLSTNPDAQRNLNWEERKQFFTSLLYKHDFGNLTFRYNGNVTNEKLISIGDPDRFGKIEDKDYFTRRIDNSLNLQGKVFTNKFIDITASYLDYQRFHDTYNVDPVTLEGTLSTTDTKDINIVKFNYGGLKAQLGKSEKSSKLNYAYGTDINFESTEGTRILDEKKAINTTALFASVNYKFTNSFEIQPAFRQTWNSTYGSLFSPAINVKLLVSMHSTLRFSYAQGFRAPSLKELYLDFHLSAGPFTYVISGNEALKVEKSNSFNLQYSYKTKTTKGNAIGFEYAMFYNDIDNLIALSQMVAFHRNYINIDKFKSVGAKIEFSYSPSEKLSFQIGSSLIGRYNKYTESSDTEEFLYTPEHTATINYEMPNTAVKFNVYYKFYGERAAFEVDNNTNNLIKATRQSFNNLDITASKSFFNKQFKMSIGIKNIFDVKDIETVNEVGAAHTRDMQLWGRSLYVRTIFNF